MSALEVALPGGDWTMRTEYDGHLAVEDWPRVCEAATQAGGAELHEATVRVAFELNLYPANVARTRPPRQYITWP